MGSIGAHASSAVSTASTNMLKSNTMALTTPYSCVCNYSNATDYFPIKLSPMYASNFNISYEKSYKLITTRAGGVTHTYAAYLCGTPVPVNVPVGTLTVEIPIKTVGLTSTTYLPYVDYLSERTSIKWVNQVPNTMNSCMRKLYDEGQLLDDTVSLGGSYYGISPQDATNITNTSGPLSAFLYGKYDDPNYPSILMGDFGKVTTPILMGETDESTSRGVFEWMYVVAALFNQEESAQTVANNVFARYNCNSGLAKAVVTTNPPKVLWGSFYNGQFTGPVCPGWECTIVTNAGATLVDTSSIANANVSIFVSNANVQSATVWIYNDFNWNFTSYYGNLPIYNGTNTALFNTLNVVKNASVFDFLGRFFEELFDNVKAEPDVLLLDVIQAAWGDSTVIKDARKRVFLRNVFSEPAVPFTPQLGSSCSNPSAPLYTDWLSGPCSTSGPPVNISYTPLVLCAPSPIPSGGALSTASLLSVAIVFVTALMGLLSG